MGMSTRFKINNSSGIELLNAYELIDGFDSLVEQIKEETYSRYPEGTAGPMGGRIMDGWQDCPAIRKIATAPRILQWLEQVYNRKPIPFQTLNFQKGTEQATHSDTIHFNPKSPGYMCGVWVAFEDIDKENGPLHYYEGSHHSPVYQFEDFNIKVDATRVGEYESAYSEFDSSYKRYEGVVKDKMNKSVYQYREFLTTKGGIAVWDCNLFHGGTPVLDKSRTRWSQVTHYFFKPDTKFSQPRLSNVADNDIFWRNIQPIES